MHNLQTVTGNCWLDFQGNYRILCVSHSSYAFGNVAVVFVYIMFEYNFLVTMVTIDSTPNLCLMKMANLHQSTPLRFTSKTNEVEIIWFFNAWQRVIMLFWIKDIIQIIRIQFYYRMKCESFWDTKQRLSITFHNLLYRFSRNIKSTLFTAMHLIPF